MGQPKCCKWTSALPAQPAGGAGSSASAQRSHGFSVLHISRDMAEADAKCARRWVHVYKSGWPCLDLLVIGNSLLSLLPYDDRLAPQSIPPCPPALLRVIQYRPRPFHVHDAPYVGRQPVHYATELRHIKLQPLVQQLISTHLLNMPARRSVVIDLQPVRPQIQHLLY